MFRSVLIAMSLLFACQPASAEQTKLVVEAEVDASIAKVWDAFTTAEGLQGWVAPLADIDFRIGGKWRANYSEDGELGDESTIENTILSYDPQRMLSLKATKFPEGFPFEKAAADTWSVFYFEALGEQQTKVTVVGLGYTDSEESKQMRAFFKPANEYSLQQLKIYLEKKPGKSD